MSNHNLIRCGDHSWAPWSVVCVHLVEGSSQEWIPVSQDEEFGEVEYDWFCPECYGKLVEAEGKSKNLDDFRCVCMHCVRDLQEREGVVILNCEE